MKKNSKVFKILVFMLISGTFLLIGTAKVSAANYSSNATYQHLDIRSLDFNKNYYNMYFEINNYGTAGIQEYEDMIFWSPIIEYFNSQVENRRLIGAEISIYISYNKKDYKYTLGFSYQEGIGLYNQYIGDDLAVLLGTQICDARTGLKTYIDLKNEDIKNFKITNIEIYTKTLNTNTQEELATQYGRWNGSGNKLTVDNQLVLDSVASVKGLSLLVVSPTLSSVYTEGEEAGYNAGELHGAEIGYETGFDDGFYEGKTQSGFGIITLMSSAIASFFSAFWTFASFEIFGIQLWIIPAILSGVGLLWFVIKFFLGKGD